MYMKSMPRLPDIIKVVTATFLRTNHQNGTKMPGLYFKKNYLLYFFKNIVKRVFTFIQWVVIGLHFLFT